MREIWPVLLVITTVCIGNCPHLLSPIHAVQARLGNLASQQAAVFPRIGLPTLALCQPWLASPSGAIQKVL